MSPDEQAQIAAYWGLNPVDPNLPQDPFAQGAAAAGISPAPPQPAGPPAPPPDPFAAGAAKAGIAPPAPEKVYNDFDPAAVTGVHPFAPPPKPAAPPPRSPAPMGPTAQDDAEFEAFKAKQAAAKPAPAPPPAAPRGPVGPPPNPDPYGINAATKKMVGSYDEQMGAARSLALHQGAQADRVGTLEAERARRRQEDASILQAEDEEAAKRMDASISEVQRQLDDVRSKKIKPMRMMDQGPGMGVMAIVGGVMGGLYQWATGSKSNPFIDDLDRMIDRQMAADEKNLDNEKAAIGQKMSLLQQQRAVYQDTRVAKLAAKNLYYEAMKDEITAEAQKYDVPMYNDRAQAAIAQLEREQGALQKQLGESLRQKDAAAAAQQYAHVKEVRDLRNSVFDKVLQATGSPEIAEAEANRQVAIVYAPGAVGARTPSGKSTNPLSAVPKDLKSEAAKEWQAHSTAEVGIRGLEEQFQKWERTGVTDQRQLASIKGTIAGIYKGSLGPGMSSDKDFEAFIEPNIPKMGDSPETLAMKRANIAATIRGKVATPILDSASPGWKPQTREEKAAALGAKPVR